jgi:hypothetical protein
MFAQIMTFNGPRSAELVAAADRTSSERLGPIMMAHPRVQEQFAALVTLRQPDGAELRILFMRDPAGFDLVRDLVLSSELLPGEDPALLPGPDGVDRYRVVEMIGSLEPIAVGGAGAGQPS